MFKVKLFNDEKPKPRRFTPEEYSTELEVAKWMKRPPCQFWGDIPFYPWVEPEPLVNFHLKFNE